MIRFKILLQTAARMAPATRASPRRVSFVARRGDGRRSTAKRVDSPIALYSMGASAAEGETARWICMEMVLSRGGGKGCGVHEQQCQGAASPAAHHASQGACWRSLRSLGRLMRGRARVARTQLTRLAACKTLARAGASSKTGQIAGLGALSQGSHRCSSAHARPCTAATSKHFAGLCSWQHRDKRLPAARSAPIHNYYDMAAAVESATCQP